MIITRWIWVALGVLSCVLVVLLHRQRALRRSRRVSSLFLWQLVYAKLHAARRRRRLLTNLILLAQVLTLLILSLALAGPHLISPQPVLSLGIIVDTSQSMGLTDVGMSRLDAAIQAITNFLRDGHATRYTLWTTTAPHLKIDTDSKDELIASLTALSNPAGNSDWDEVLSVLPSRFSQDLSFHLIIASDGATGPIHSDLLATLSRVGNVHLIQVGTPIENVGITQMQVRPIGSDPWTHQVLVEVSNFASVSRDIELKITEQVPMIDAMSLSDPSLIALETLHVAPRQSEVFIFEWLLKDGAVLQAALSDHDNFPFDDVAHVYANQPGPTRVLVVGEDNHFLTSALNVIDSLDVVHSDTNSWATQGPFDLAIFNEVPVPFDFVGNAMHFAPGDTATQENTRAANSIVWWQQAHPLFRFVDWNTVHVSSHDPLLSDPAHQVLIQGVSGPLMVLDETETRRILSVGFSISQSDLPYRIAFPIFLGNVLDWADPARGAFTVPPTGLLSREESDLSIRWLESLDPSGARLLGATPPLPTLTDSSGLRNDDIQSTGHRTVDTKGPVFQPRLWQWAAFVAALFILLEGMLYLGPRRSEARR